MRKAKDPFDKVKKLLQHPLIDNAGMYKQLGMSRGKYREKLNNLYGHRFTDQDKKKIITLLKKFSKQLTNGLYQKKKL